MKTANHTLTSSIRLTVLVMLFLLSTSMVFSQNPKAAIINAKMSIEVTITSNDNQVSSAQTTTQNTNLGLFSWFMGSKQVPNSNMTIEGSRNVKQIMISSGIAPNRLLIKTFMKKATGNLEATA